MSENEKTTREGPADVELEGDATTYRGRVADFFWNLNYAVVAAIAGVVLVVACIVWGVVNTQRAWRGECHNAGGHVIEVEKADICVDRDNRVILI